MSGIVRSNHQNSSMLFDAGTSLIHYGYGLDAFDLSRRLASGNREAIIDILSKLERLIGSKADSEEMWTRNWDALRESVLALRSSEDAECVAGIFSTLRFLAPPSEIREIHR